MKKVTFLLITLMSFSLFAQNSIRTNTVKHDGTQHPVTVIHNPVRSAMTTVHFSENFDAGIPATWTVNDLNTSGFTWQGANDYNGSTLDGTPFAFVNSDAAGQSATLDTDLISPVIDLSAATAAYLSFDQYYLTYTGADTADVEVFDGSNWVNVFTTNADIGAWGNPDHQEIDISAYLNANFQVRFHYYNANWEYYWAVDNVTIYTPDANDLSVTNIKPSFAFAGDDVTIIVDVKNAGTANQDTFDVQVVITDSSSNTVYDQTENITGAALAAGATYVVTMPTTYTTGMNSETLSVTATVTLSGDSDNSNDTMTSNLDVVDFSYDADKVYSFVAYDADSSGDNNFVVTFDLPSGSITNSAAAAATNDFLTGGTFVDDVLTAVEFGTNDVYFVNGDGTAYKYGTISGLAASDNVTGVAFDDTMGGFVSSGGSLYSVDSNLNATFIGSFGITDSSGSDGLIIGIAFDRVNHVLYGIDIATDSLYTIDPATGVATLVGALGLDISYAQDLGSDPTTGAIYGTLYEIGGNTGGLYAIDVLTGAATLIGTATQDEYTICAIKETTLSISDNIIEGLKVYPNPFESKLILTADDTIQKVEILNMLGQVIITQTGTTDKMTLNVEGLAAGNYIVKIYTSQTVGSKQLIKK